MTAGRAGTKLPNLPNLDFRVYAVETGERASERARKKESRFRLRPRFLRLQKIRELFLFFF